MTDPFDTVRPLLNNIAMEFGHDDLCRTNSGFPEHRAKGCNCSRAEAKEALTALASIEEALREAERLGSQWLCDCHTWPDADEAHAYIVAIEERLADAERGWTAASTQREGYRKELEKAEARIAELKRALRRVLHQAAGPDGQLGGIRETARRALASGKDKP